MTEVLALSAGEYAPHWLHGADRVFQETNCAADLWIEALASLGLDPVLGLAFTLSTDFDGDQWRMFTFPPEDLRSLYGIEMDELNLWRPLADHLEDQLALGHLVILDVDAWHLPDTAGLTYRCAHQKTSIMVQALDRRAGTLGYFHNTGYYELGGDDLTALLEPGSGAGHPALPPFAWSVRLERLRRSDACTLHEAEALTREHLGRRPASNPVARLRLRVAKDLDWLTGSDLDTFHRYAFGTLRQCGATAELAASHLRWVGTRPGWADGPGPSTPRCSSAPAVSTPPVDTAGAAAALTEVATSMKAIEFALARAVRGRSCSPEALFGPAEAAWERAFDLLGDPGR